MEGERPQCRCKKSHCLRRYCECFGTMWYCSENCACYDCQNTEDNADEVEEQAELILKNKPDAFKSKIADDAIDAQNYNVGDEQRRHVKGCTCQKSRCSKMYCECFKNNVGCTSLCQCQGCGNRFGRKGGDSNTELEQLGSKSDGTMILIDEMLWPAEASQMENFVQFGDPWHIDSHTEALSDYGVENMMLEHTRDGEYFLPVAHGQTHQSFVPDDAFPDHIATFMLEDPSNLYDGHVADVGDSPAAEKTSDAKPGSQSSFGGASA